MVACAMREQPFFLSKMWLIISLLLKIFCFSLNNLYICVNKINSAMDKVKYLPQICPSCGSTLRVKAMHCAHCDTNVVGDYSQPAFMRMSKEDQEFIVDFVLCSGSLKEMAQKMGLSYPTVRNRLDDLISTLSRVAELSAEGKTNK